MLCAVTATPSAPCTEMLQCLDGQQDLSCGLSITVHAPSLSAVVLYGCAHPCIVTPTFSPGLASPLRNARVPYSELVCRTMSSPKKCGIWTAAAAAAVANSRTTGIK